MSLKSSRYAHNIILCTEILPGVYFRPHKGMCNTYINTMYSVFISHLQPIKLRIFGKSRQYCTRTWTGSSITFPTCHYSAQNKYGITCCNKVFAVLDFGPHRYVCKKQTNMYTIYTVCL